MSDDRAPPPAGDLSSAASSTSAGGCDAAHSLRTPLTIARGHLELVEDELPEGSKRDDVGVALDELRRLSGMSDRLLLLCTADEPSFLSKTRLDVGDLVRDVAARWQAASRRPIAIDVDGSFTVRADEDRVRIALDALIENALRATELGGDVALAARDDGEGVAIEVRDTGPGVPADARDRIFDRFYRVDVESVHRGSGLGLAVVKAIAQAHGGTVTLASDPGHTAFALHLPCVAGPATPAPITDFPSVSFPDTRLRGGTLAPGGTAAVVEHEPHRPRRHRTHTDVALRRRLRGFDHASLSERSRSPAWGQATVDRADHARGARWTRLGPRDSSVRRRLVRATAHEAVATRDREAVRDSRCANAVVR